MTEIGSTRLSRNAVHQPVGSSSSKPTWTCAVCTSELLCQPQYIDGSQVCAPCLRHFFELALSDSTSLPPKWGRQTLNHWDFRHVLDNNILRRLDERYREQRCPAPERVYCSHFRGEDACGAFLGRRSNAEFVCKLCPQCRLYTCLRCSACFPPVREDRSEIRIPHHCQPPAENHAAAQQDLDVAFEGLVRGKDYQSCPDCGQRVQLADGCNHITCICGEQFCYLCGERARELSNHWDRRRDGCPRYGQIGDREALYSDEVIFGEDDAIESESDMEHEDFARWAVPRALDRQERREFERQRRQDELREHGRHYARELAGHMNEQAASQRDRVEQPFRADSPRRRGAIDHGRPPSHNHEYEASRARSASSQRYANERRSENDIREGVRLLNANDRGWRDGRSERPRRLQVEMDWHHRSPTPFVSSRGAYSTLPRPRSDGIDEYVTFVQRRDRARPLHHHRSWQARGRTNSSSSSDSHRSGFFHQSSRRPAQQGEGRLSNSRRRRESLHRRRRQRDIAIDIPSRGDTVDVDDEPLISERSRRRSHVVIEPEGRVRSLSTASRPRRVRSPTRHSERPRSQQVPRASIRTPTQSSDSDSEYREAEQDAFVRQYGAGRRLEISRDNRPRSRSRPSIGNRVWQLCHALSDAILGD